MKRSSLLFIGLVAVLVLAPIAVSVLHVSPTHAQVKPPSIPLTQSPNSIKGFVCKMAGWLFTGAIILSIILAIWTGIQYMTAAGDPEKFKSAHKKLMYIAVGIAVALIARGMPVIIKGVLQGGSGSLDPCVGQYT